MELNQPNVFNFESKIRKMIDLRSDTVTKPCPEMIKAMAAAVVGDDVFGEDPTVNELEAFAAQYFGKEAALFCVSGTQTNQIAINVHVKPGGEVICHEESHIYKYEGGGIARNSGASVRLLRGDRGRITAAEIEKYINPIHDVHFPITQLVSIEDSANRGGGAIYDFEEILKIKAVCQANNLPLHLDGARLMNALAVNGIDTHTYCALFDSISICLSKGLGAPVGSLLLGSADFIYKARRVRKVFGGGMRQAGFIAAAGLFALKYNVDRLIHDHSHAKLLEIGLKKCAWVADIVPVETNIVIIQLTEMDRRDQLILELAKNGIKVIAFGPGLIRMVTHLQITKEDIEEVCSKALTIS
jgi:threonine aldolase